MKAGLALGMVCVICWAPLARADDFAPPTYRGKAWTALYEWEFRTSANPLGPDGDLATVEGDGPGDPTATITGLTWISGDGDGAWVCGGAGGTIVLNLPNWIDLYPRKDMRIQVTYGTAVPVINLTAFDFGTESYIDHGRVEQVVVDGTHMYEDWYILPNPDWEQVAIAVPLGGSVDQIVVDTITPEPASLAILALGSAALAALRRRRR